MLSPVRMFLNRSIQQTFLKTLLLFAVTFFCSFFLSAVTIPFLNKDPELYADVQKRLNALKNFTSSDHYRWDITWLNPSGRAKGIFIGQTIGYSHWIQVEFGNGHVLCFDKFNPTIALYPNRLSLYPIDCWGNPLKDNPALCCYLIAMPFLNWPIIFCEKSAKKGRKAISVCLQQGPWSAHVYLDKHFNTILSVELYNKGKNVKGTFALKNLKKYKQGWGLHKAEFSLKGEKTTLVVNNVQDQ